MTRFRYPLFLQLILKIGLPLLIIYILIYLYTYHVSKEIAISQTKDYLMEHLLYNSQKIDKEFSELAKISQAINSFIQVHYPIDIDNLNKFIGEILNKSNRNIGAGYAFLPFKGDSSIEYLANLNLWRNHQMQLLDLNKHYYYLQEPWFVVPNKMRISYWTEPFWGKISRDYHVRYVYPIIIDEENIGVTFTDMQINSLADLIDNSSLKKGFMFIVSKTGTFVYHPNSDYIMLETIFSLAEQYNRPEIRKQGRELISFPYSDDYQAGMEVTIDNYHGIEVTEKRWIMTTPMPSTGWILAAVISEKEALSDVSIIAKYQKIYFLLGLLVIICIIIFISRSQARRIEKLTNITNMIAKGNLDIHHDLFLDLAKSNDEIATLSKNFSKMIVDLNQHIKEKLEHEKKIEKEKAKAIIAMAVTVNHEINQHLTIIQLAKEYLDGIEYPSENAEKIQKYLDKMQIAISELNKILIKYRTQNEVKLVKYLHDTDMVTFES